MTTTKEHRENLVAALRSGKYKQGYGVLKNCKDEYCCLGVACNLIDSTKWEKLEYDTNDREHYKFSAGANTTTALLPKPIQKKYGFTENDGQFKLDSLSKELLKKIKNSSSGGSWDLQFATLTTLNDRDVSFDVIADIIEAEPKGMFV